MNFDMAIIGGGVIGMEFASLFNSMGVKVHVVEMMSEILETMDKEISGMLRLEYAERGVVFHLDTKVVEVNSGGVVIEKEGETSLIKADKVLFSVGCKANITHVALDHLNIEIDRTSHPRVYACEGILGIGDPTNSGCIPKVVYTNPEVAGVGKTEEELIKLGLPYRVMKLPMTYSGRFMAEDKQGRGVCKLIQNEEGKMVGCHLLGNPVSELIMIAGIAIQRGYTIEEFQNTVF